MKKLYTIGQSILVLGSVLYLIDVLNLLSRIPALAAFTYKRGYSTTTTWVIGSIYAVALILMLIGRIGSGKPKKD